MRDIVRHEIIEIIAIALKKNVFVEAMFDENGNMTLFFAMPKVEEFSKSGFCQGEKCFIPLKE